ncbi:hypothetical protein GF377_06260, partial [candidate division GN15 bacterium]|nr:hypothetical protein [candidate division GN15 bacterium]
MKLDTLKNYWPVAPALAVFAWFSYLLRFTQDDAYITYRYVANYLNGHGLVFNIGERIEGITNFGWAILLSLFGVFGIDFTALAGWLGWLFGAGIIVLVYRLSLKLFDDNIWYSLGAVLLIGGNLSFAYWSQAGLETAAFAFFAVLSLCFYITRNWLLVFSLVMAVWLRPEGAMVTGLLILVELIQTRRLPKFTLASAAIAFVLSLPFVGFKLAYYGDILPNPFYAKTSFAISQWSDGFEYAWRYLQHYGFYGAPFVLPLILYRSLKPAARAVLQYSLIYLAYIVFIGGDVLKVHRFFLPVFGPAAILTVLSIRLLTQKLGERNRQAAYG